MSKEKIKRIEKIEVISVTESERGCGVRIEGAYVRMYDSPTQDIAIPLATCSCCGGGAVRQKGWQNITVGQLRQRAYLAEQPMPEIFDGVDGDVKVMLIFVGREHYHDLDLYLEESGEMGISRRIGYLPQSMPDLSNFYVALAYPRATVSMIQKYGWDVRTFRPNDKTVTLAQSIAINGFVIDRGAVGVKKHHAELQGVIFHVGEAHMEYVCGERTSKEPNRTMIRGAKKGLTFVHNQTAGVGGVQTKPNGDGSWGVYKNGAFVKNAESTTVLVDEVKICSDTKRKKKK